MRNTTKALIIIFSIILTIGSCRKSDYVPAPKLDLGKVSTTMSFASQIMLVNTNTYSFDVYTTIGSKYSIQVANMEGKVLLSKGLVADEVKENVTLNIENYPKGIYELIFIDTQGKEIKQPLIVK